MKPLRLLRPAWRFRVTGLVLLSTAACISGAQQLPTLSGSSFSVAASGESQDANISPPQPGQPATSDSNKPKVTTAEQLRKQEHQRVLGILPNFNTADLQDAARLTPKQKFRLAFRSAVDPATIGIAGVVAGFAQWDNSFAGYGQGAAGYFKRFGASYADTFDGTMIGNAVFPVLLHQDPRYFRKGSGSFGSRLLYAMASTIRCKDDNGHWAPNYSNVMGNLAAGGISNLYYPSGDRGAANTVERALTVSAEGALGALFYEFYPDLQRRAHHSKP